MKIDGKQIANKILLNLRNKVEKLKEKGTTPCLAIILVGNDPASAAYIRQKKIKAEEIGAKTSIKRMSAKTTVSSLLKTIGQLNNDDNVHAILVQEPLPLHIDPLKIRSFIDPRKDVDAVTPNSKFEMPIVMAVLRILDAVFMMTERGVAREGGFPTARTVKGALAGRNRVTGPRVDLLSWLKKQKIVIVGKGKTGGKPIIGALRKLGIEPLIIDSKTKNPENLIKTADIIISAVGKPNIVKPQMIRQGVVLIGIGISRGESAKITGDYSENEVSSIASFYTPTPGGVGPVNVAYLLKNLLTACENLSR